ncbi:hypothetical protein ABZ897_27540 [Nonomuraea sp. NPDC046802]|uniref:aromatic-ring hydroxylase C-terminal domain-containing protein n=1 Tax=Nonomuraea sp. NPDC046802 TaxID=3154919 RepID=UPI0033C1B893
MLRSGRFVLVHNGTDIFGTHRDRLDLARLANPGAEGFPALTLVRPDGYTAWAGDDATAAHTAITRWCGPAQRTTTT